MSKKPETITTIFFCYIMGPLAPLPSIARLGRSDQLLKTAVIFCPDLPGFLPLYVASVWELKKRTKTSRVVPFTAFDWNTPSTSRIFFICSVQILLSDSSKKEWGEGREPPLSWLSHCRQRASPHLCNNATPPTNMYVFFWVEHIGPGGLLNRQIEKL